MPTLLTQLAVDLLRLLLWLAILVVIFAPLEKLWPQRPKPFLRKAFRVDLAYYFLSGVAPKLLLVVPLTFLANVIHRYFVADFYFWVAALPPWVRFSSAIVVGEVGAYWGHRWSHQIPFLWRFHAVHHSAEEIDWLVNSRAHPIDIAFTRLCDMVPMYLLGLAQPMGNTVDLVPVWVTLASTVWGFFVHANVNWRFGWVEWVVSTPGFHHWHHTNDSPGHMNKNYAPLLPLVDKVFGTLYLPRKEWPERYGIDTPTPPGFVGQLLGPFLPATSPSQEAEGRAPSLIPAE